MNQIALMGRLTADPELRETTTGVPVVRFTLAVNRSYTSKDGDRKTDFIDIVAWRSTAVFVSKYFTKGQMAALTGRLELRDWTDKEGNKRRSAEVIADNIFFTDSKKSREGGNSGGTSTDYGAADMAPVESSDFTELDEDDGDLPF